MEVSIGQDVIIQQYIKYVNIFFDIIIISG